MIVVRILHLNVDLLWHQLNSRESRLGSQNVRQILVVYLTNLANQDIDYDELQPNSILKFRAYNE